LTATNEVTDVTMTCSAAVDDVTTSSRHLATVICIGVARGALGARLPPPFPSCPTPHGDNKNWGLIKRGKL